MNAQRRIVVLISGRGSNLGALLEARLPLQVVAVISHKADAAGLGLAQEWGIPTRVISAEAYAERTDFDRALQQAIDGFAPDLVVLAGFMRILTPEFVTHYQGRLLNIHPSLLPAFPGLHTHRRALAEGVAVHGCTVHFVTSELDRGPIVAQGVVPVWAGDDEASLAARVLSMEHRLFPHVLRAWVESRWVLEANGHVRWRDDSQEQNLRLLWAGDSQ
ncbi:phosphoribosylglycinamide formyltransferase [Ferrovum myxofaciens]|uniref:Phosphoribosylglycinamide formyltransferase n=2 Tax=root TaxID=1 RepID=A0A149VXB2_9PROT|nr:phosphoribosylglycinamide formyltransferase [Ferrovum myxofaciens]KXW57865.1 phosphoribosylglycinamide formyltransferase [Ferrovum myxofaciens]